MVFGELNYIQFCDSLGGHNIYIKYDSTVLEIIDYGVYFKVPINHLLFVF